MTPEQINSLIQQLLKTGEILATKAFEISLKQVYALSILDGVIALICLILAIVLFRLASITQDGDTSVFEFLMGVVLSIICLINASYVLMYLLNPEWYAIQLILTQLIKL